MDGQLGLSNDQSELQLQSSITIRSRPLDVHSPHYVPRWLRAVNESNAHLHLCESFPREDFISYMATLVGHDFARDVSPVSLPPPIPVPIHADELSFQNYASYWLQCLQNEFTQQHKQHESFSLYDRPLQKIDSRPGHFIVHVPGLRENVPRLDLGDVIHVRPLQTVVGSIDYSVSHWLDYGKNQGVICPGFTGVLYDPCIWEIDRLNEKITIRIDNLSENTRCNIIFPLQASKLEPVCRAVQTASHGGPWLRRMLFPQQEDGVVQTNLSRAHFDIPWIDDLNWEQKKAVYTILSANYGSIPYLISGPPGTGKTRTLVESTLQLLANPGHILICAPSDTAADTLALRLSMHLDPSQLFRLNSWTRTFAEVPDRLLVYTHSGGLCFSLPPVERLLSFRVVVTTCREADLLVRARLTNIAIHNLFSGVERLLKPASGPRPLHWTALLLDEAAQATEPDVLIPLTVVQPPDGSVDPQFITVGDQHQLGPKLLSSSGLEITLFQRLFERALYDDHPLSRKHGTQFISASMLPMVRPAFTNLIRNYRSHPAILSVPSALFYNDTLIPERKTSEDVLSWPGWPPRRKWPVCFVQNTSQDRYESIVDGDGTGVGTLFNLGETTVALETAKSLLRHNDADGNPVLRQKDIMVMSPFRAQVNRLRAVFRRNKLYEVNIGPLEAFQGLESRIVILCTTRTRLGVNGQAVHHHVLIDKARGLGVIDEPRRFNVATTRAQEGLVVIGNAECLISTGDKQWLAFLGFCVRNHCFKLPDGYEWPDFGPWHPPSRLERALTYALPSEHDAGEHDENEHDAAMSEEQDVPQNIPKLSLKGPLREIDEQMWLFKEVAHANGCEEIDLFPDEQCMISSTVSRSLSTSSMRQGTGNPSVDEYDRNLKQEFQRECTTQ